MNLNLTKQDCGFVKYKVDKFPDGQQDIRITNVADIIDYMVDEDNNPTPNVIFIQSRMNNWKDIELILCAVAALRRIGVEKIILSVPYILGARSDRQFVKGGTSYLVDVVAPVINSCNFMEVQSLDTHSDVAAACIKNLQITSNSTIVRNAILNHFKLNLDRCTIVSPDAGALKKIYDVTEFLSKNVKGELPLAIGMKHRDVKTGKILSTDVILPNETEGNMSASIPNYVIIDDICDGGRTFIELAKVLREKSYGCKVYLIVSHAIFSAGIEVLAEHFDGVSSTNSIADRVNEGKFHYVNVL